MGVDERFHQLLYEAANDELLSDSLNRLHALSMRLWHLVLSELGDVRPAIEQHRGIMEAVKRGEGELAETLLQQHVAGFQRAIKAAL